MTEQLKSTIRHILTALGVVVGLFGIGQATEVINFTLGNLDTVWASIVALVGFVTSIVGFFKDKQRFEAREAAK